MSTGQAAEPALRGRDGYRAPARCRRLHDEGPVLRIENQDGRPTFLITRMDELRTAMSDPRFSREELSRLGGKTAPVVLFERPSVLDLDPPEHARLRRLAAKAFTAHRVRGLRPRIQEITDELLSDMARQGPPVDLNGVLCFPLPIAVICEILGVPYEDRDRFREWSRRITSVSAYTPEESLEALGSLVDYMSGLISTKREQPDSSLLQDMISARDEGDRLSEEELVTFGFGLLVAGHETTASMIGKGLVALFDHPRQLESLREDPSLLPSTVEEVLRYVSLGDRPDGGLTRATTDDVELGGITIPAHSIVLASTMAANQDPRAFPEPDRFDVDRAGASGHVAFGHGPHHCLGAQLARMELEVAIGSLLRDFPTVRLACPVEEVSYTEGMLITGLRELPVTWNQPA